MASKPRWLPLDAVACVMSECLRAMPWDAVGMYYELILTQWERGSIPLEPAGVHRRLRKEGFKLRLPHFLALWEQYLSQHFPVAGTGRANFQLAELREKLFQGGRITDGFDPDLGSNGDRIVLESARYDPHSNTNGARIEIVSIAKPAKTGHQKKEIGGTGETGGEVIVSDESDTARGAPDPIPKPDAQKPARKKRETKPREPRPPKPPAEPMPWTIAEMLDVIRESCNGWVLVDPFEAGLATPLTAVIRALHGLGRTLADVRLAAEYLAAVVPSWPGGALPLGWLAKTANLSQAITKAHDWHSRGRKIAVAGGGYREPSGIPHVPRTSHDIPRRGPDQPVPNAVKAPPEMLGGFGYKPPVKTEPVKASS